MNITLHVTVIIIFSTHHSKIPWGLCPGTPPPPIMGEEGEKETTKKQGENLWLVERVTYVSPGGPTRIWKWRTSAYRQMKVDKLVQIGSKFIFKYFIPQIVPNGMMPVEYRVKHFDVMQNEDRTKFLVDYVMSRHSIHLQPHNASNMHYI